MPFYLSVCKEPGKKKPFLLISEQQLDLKRPSIRAQVYFKAPPAKLKNQEVEIASYPISKKEVEILLNAAQKRQSHGFRSTGLFAEGKVDKNALFNVFSYPSTVKIDDLLAAINIKHQEQDFTLLKVIPDNEHVLDNRHRIFWENFFSLNPRENMLRDNWTNNEIEETDLMYELNLIRMYYNEKYNIPIED